MIIRKKKTPSQPLTLGMRVEQKLWGDLVDFCDFSFVFSRTGKSRPDSMQSYTSHVALALGAL